MLHCDTFSALKRRVCFKLFHLNDWSLYGSQSFCLKHKTSSKGLLRKSLHNRGILFGYEQIFHALSRLPIKFSPRQVFDTRNCFMWVRLGKNFLVIYLYLGERKKSFCFPRSFWGKFYTSSIEQTFFNIFKVRMLRKDVEKLWISVNGRGETKGKGLWSASFQRKKKVNKCQHVDIDFLKSSMNLEALSSVDDSQPLLT